MNRYANIFVVMLVLSVFTSTASSSVPVMEQVESAVAPASAGEQAINFTKLEISPRYGNLRLQAGESKETTVTIKNKEKQAVSVKPNVVIAPYGEYMMDAEWITVTPASAEIPAGGSQKFTVKASIPDDTTSGYYSAQVAFTDEEMPTPYPMPFPNYIHAFQLSVDVWSEPKIQIMTRYISDQLEAGKEYEYEIKLKNTANEPIGINPKLGNDNMYYGGPFGMTTPALTDDSITITAPSSVPAGATETVKIRVKVPADSNGYYNNYIDLGIDDMSIREWERRVDLNFNIWKQPTEPYSRSFSLEKAAPITIEINSNSNYYGYPFGKSQKESKEPSFETTLKDPEGKSVELKVTKTVIKGNINMGGERPPWESDSESIYQENSVQYSVTYTAEGSPGKWLLEVLPKNTQGFDYSITVGE